MSWNKFVERAEELLRYHRLDEEDQEFLDTFQEFLEEKEGARLGVLSDEIVKFSVEEDWQGKFWTVKAETHRGEHTLRVRRERRRRWAASYRYGDRRDTIKANGYNWRDVLSQWELAVENDRRQWERERERLENPIPDGVEKGERAGTCRCGSPAWETNVLDVRVCARGHMWRTFMAEREKFSRSLAKELAGLPHEEQVEEYNRRATSGGIALGVPNY